MGNVIKDFNDKIAGMNAFERDDLWQDAIAEVRNGNKDEEFKLHALANALKMDLQQDKGTNGTTTEQPS